MVHILEYIHSYQTKFPGIKVLNIQLNPDIHSYDHISIDTGSREQENNNPEGVPLIGQIRPGGNQIIEKRHSEKVISPLT